MLIIIITFFISYLIYRNNSTDIISYPKFALYFYFAISSIISIGVILGFLSIFGYKQINAMLWSMYIPFSMNISYLLFEIVCNNKRIISCVELWLKTFICTTLFYTCFQAYYVNNNCISFQVTSTLIILIGSLVLLYGDKLFSPIKAYVQYIYIVLLIITPILMFFILEVSSNPYIKDMSNISIFINILIMLLIEIIVLNIFSNRIYGFYILYFGALLIGIANYFVIKFRSSPIMPTDIFAIRTALSVSTGYRYDLTDGVCIALVTTFLLISLISTLNHLITANKLINIKEKIVKKSFSVIVVILSTLWISTSNFEQSYNIILDWWKPVTTYYNNGFTISFIAFLQKLKVERPETYTSRLSGEILGDTKNKRKEVDIFAMQKPSIIVIMNESFSDLSVLGTFESTKDHLKNFYSLKSDPGIIEHGYNYVSIRGGGTPNSEFEFLTGNSMSNLPGYYPYVMFDFKNMPSIVQNVKAQGYKAIAMHPEDPNNWKRNEVYPAMGFDEFLSYKNFSGDDTLLIDRISDLSNYNRLIKVYESQEQPSFIFNVTMQNHGGYNVNIINEEKKVSIDDRYTQYTDVQEYQSLINYSDEALGYLINYFKFIEEPVIICFFGDHQPALNNEFENKLVDSGWRFDGSDVLNQEKYFSVPYFIWSNYEIDKSYAKTTYDGINVTSTNYLGVQVQYYAGLTLSRYGDFLLDQKEQIPVINRLGYLGDDDKWYSFSDNSEYYKRIINYQIVQYNGMFDKKKNEELFNLKEMH